MKKLLDFIIKNLTGSEDYEITESTDGNKVTLSVKPSSSLVGLLIGKEGRTIRSIRKVMSIKGTLEGKLVNIAIISPEDTQN